MTRKEAIEKNLNVFDGNVCLKCDGTLRYVSSGSCKVCSLLKLKNDDLMRPYRTKEKQREKLRNWRKNNPEKYKVQTRKNNQIDANSKAAIRRARVKNQLPPDADLKKIRAVYSEAKRLTILTGIQHEVDHIVAIANGGLHHESNLQVLTKEMNRRKGRS